MEDINTHLLFTVWSTAHQLMETIWKGKQTNKQISGGGTCRGTDAGGSVELCNMQSLICIGDALEKCGVQYAGSYSDTHAVYTV